MMHKMAFEMFVLNTYWKYRYFMRIIGYVLCHARRKYCMALRACAWEMLELR
jgi:hypothetical protein